MLVTILLSSFNFLGRLHSRKLAVKRLGIASRKSVSNIHSFKNVTESSLNELWKTQLKKRTEAKMMWV